MKLLFSLILCLSTLVFAEFKDSLYVQFSGETVKIWNAAELNCCSKYKFEAEINGYHIKLTEIDTAKDLCYCMCDFNLCASLTGLAPGEYIVDVYRNLLFSIPPDSLFYVGNITFNISGAKSPRLAQSYQSSCNSDLNNTLQSQEFEITPPKDSLFIEFIEDTVKIWNYNVYTNCCSQFLMETEISGNLIKFIEIDTSLQLCNCLCTFNISGSIVNLKKGHYKTEVYRLTKYSDDSLYIGSIEFDITDSSYSAFPVKSYQSKCLNEQQEEVVVYSNKFESVEDTSGWNGYMDFRNDVPSGGGKQSVFISGGCIWPHAWFDLPPNEEDGYYILRCWGKDLEIGGIIGIRLKDDFMKEALITINEEEWTYYESPDTLFCPAGQSIVIFMGAGGIIPSAMLVDNIEILKIISSKPVTVYNGNEKGNLSSFQLFQNYPNPFNPVTKIKYVIPTSSNPQFVSLKVYDILGNVIATLLEKEQLSGSYETEFDGSRFSSGIYIYVLNIDGRSIQRKMCLIK